MSRVSSLTVTSGGRRRLSVSAMFAIASLLAGALAALPPHRPADACELKPVIRDVIVTQGSSDYDVLAWGKTTLVRPRMTTPECAPDAVITVTDATVTMTAGVVPLAQLVPLPELPASNRVTVCCKPGPDNAADPIFTVDKAAFDALAASTTGGFEAAFAFKIDFVANGVSDTVVHTAKKTFSLRTNAVRVLAVPLGDGVQQRPDEFSTADEESTLRAFDVLWRMLPVEDGITDLRGDGGLRRQIVDSAMIDIGPNGLNLLDGNGRYCDAGWDDLEHEMLMTLMAWNTLNEQLSADHITGVVGDQVFDPNCGVVGRAGIPGSASWFKVSSPDVQRPRDGAILAMELMHNYGLVGKTDRRPHKLSPHSGTTVADPNNQAYDILTGKRVADGRPVMGELVAAFEDDAFAEVWDWAWTRCTLGGSVQLGGCASPNTVGSPVPGTRPLFKLVANYDPVAGVGEFRSHVTGGGNPTAPGDTDEYTLIFRDADTVGEPQMGSTINLPTTVEYGHSGHAGHEHAGESETVHIRAEVNFPDGAEIAEVYEGAPGPLNAPLYRAQFAATEAQDVDHWASGWDFAPTWASPVADESQPSFDRTGTYVAFVRSTPNAAAPAGSCEVAIGVVADGSIADTLPVPCGAAESPSIAPDGEALAYVCDGGDICLVEMDGAGAFTDAPVRVYECARFGTSLCASGTNDPLKGAATSLEWSPTAVDAKLDQWIAVAIDGELYSLKPYQRLAGEEVALHTGFTRLTTTSAAEDSPTVSPDGRRVAFSRAGATGTSVLTLKIDDGTETLIADDARTPDWAADRIAYVRDVSGTPRVFDARTAGQDEREITVGTAPTYLPGTGSTLAVVRPDVAGEGDVYVGTSVERFDVVVRGRTDAPGEARGYVYLKHGGLYHPIGVDLDPTYPDPSDPSLVEFYLRGYDPSRAPAGATFVGGISTGIVFTTIQGETMPTKDRPPVAVIVQPAPTNTIQTTDALAIDVRAWDPETGSLPASQGRVTLELPDGTVRVLGDASRRRVGARQVTGAAEWPIGAYTLCASFTAGDDTVTKCRSFAIDVVLANVEAKKSLDLDSAEDGDKIKFDVTAPSVDITTVHEVRIIRVNGTVVDAVHAKLLSKEDGRLKAWFDRAEINALIDSVPGTRGNYVEIVLEGTGSGFRFRGADPQGPYIEP